MKLKIDDPKNILDASFIEWFKMKIRDKIIGDSKFDKLDKWDKFFNSQNIYKSIYKKKILTYDIILAGANNLRSIRNNNTVYLDIDPNIYYIGLDRVKLEILCKTINFGNIEVAGYPIFSDTFKYFSENIKSYIDIYLIGIR